MRYSFINAVLLLGLAALVVAHGGDEGMEDMGRPTMITTNTTIKQPESYSQLEHSSTLVAHIVLMTLAWVFILPIGKYLSFFQVSSDKFCLKKTPSKFTDTHICHCRRCTLDRKISTKHPRTNYLPLCQRFGVVIWHNIQ